MTDLKITTVNDFDEDGIFPLRTVRAGDKSVRTPTVATRCDKLQTTEEVHSESRGVNELYRTVGGDNLDEAMQNSDGGQVNSDLEDQFEKVGEGELAITSTKYTEASTLGPGHAAYLADIHAAYSDIITVPMMPKMVRNVGSEDNEEDRGLNDTNYQSFKQSVAAFLHAVEERHPEKPVMGLIPKLGWEFIDDLMRLYESHDVRAYAFDFDRCKVTTGTQLSMIRPLMQSIADRGIENHVLFYAINPSPGVRSEALGGRPASDIASLGLGFDIIGGRHVSPRQPEEVFEEMEAQDGDEDEPSFRLFDRSEWMYREVLASDLVDQFPEESAFDPERIAARIRVSQSNAKYRFQALVNSEQMGLAAADFRAELEDGDAQAALRRKTGVTRQAKSAYENVREAFDEERFQSGLGDFA